ncbi:MAG: restriction endonuclease [Bdellovibrionota bacterium]|jgi:hypothetical protein
MKITESFIEDILLSSYGDKYQEIYDRSYLIQYLDKKMGAIHGNCKTRRSLANIYAIYSILNFYRNDFYNNPKSYRKFLGYDYTQLLSFCRSLYGGNKLQNHAFNSRVNSEFKNKFQNVANDLIIINSGKYLLHIDYLYIGKIDISQVCCEIIEKYIDLLIEKDHALVGILQNIKRTNDYNKKKDLIKSLLTEDAEARIFEIISYSILKNHYRHIEIYWGYTKSSLVKDKLELFKTGRTNANDGGIDFVMKPLGRFFQVTEVGNYDKYLLDLDKVLHFPITFVIKTKLEKEKVLKDLNEHIKIRANGMKVIQERYYKAIEEIITINELIQWIDELGNRDIANILRDIDICYKLEMNIF